MLPMDVAGAAQREVEGAGSDGAVGLAVDQDEGTEVAVVRVGLERDRLIHVQVDLPDFVQFQVLGGHLFLGVDVDLVFDLGDLGADGAAADLKPVPLGRESSREGVCESVKILGVARSLTQKKKKD